MAVLADWLLVHVVIALVVSPIWGTALCLWFAGLRARALGRHPPESWQTQGVVVGHRDLVGTDGRPAQASLISYRLANGANGLLVEAERRGGRQPKLGTTVDVAVDTATGGVATFDAQRYRSGVVVGVVASLVLLVWLVLFWGTAVPIVAIILFESVRGRRRYGRTLGQRLARRTLDPAAVARIAANATVSADVVAEAQWIGRVVRASSWQRQRGLQVGVAALIGVVGIGFIDGPTEILLPTGLAAGVFGLRMIEEGLPHPFGGRTVDIKRSDVPDGADAGMRSTVVVIEEAPDGDRTVHTGRTVDDAEAPVGGGSAKATVGDESAPSLADQFPMSSRMTIAASGFAVAGWALWWITGVAVLVMAVWYGAEVFRRLRSTSLDTPRWREGLNAAEVQRAADGGTAVG